MRWYRWRKPLALGAVGLVAASFLADIPLQLAIAHAPPLTASATYGGTGASLVGTLLFNVPMGLLAVLATVIVLRRGGNTIGWMLLGAIVVLSVAGAIGDYGTYAIAVEHRTIPGGDLAVGLGNYSWAPFVTLILVLPLQLFPDGHLLSRGWRWLTWVTIGALIVGYVGGTFGPGLSGSIHFPHATDGFLGAVLGLAQAALAVVGLCGALGLVSLFLRYRRSATEVRHQIRWLFIPGLLYVVPFLGYITLASAASLDLEWLAGISVVGLAAVPFAMAIAVLKYRLYDIDIIISRTLLYGSLAVFITAVYVAIAVGIGTLVGSGGKPSLALSILATAIVAIGFQPVRERVQKVANRLVYGKRATPYEVLSEFSGRVAETYAADEVLPRMARVLQEGTGAESATVWLRGNAELRPAATYPEGMEAWQSQPMSNGTLPTLLEATRATEVRHQGELLGALSVIKRRGEALTPIEEKLVEDLAHQAGLLLKNVGLAADLQARLEELRASRQRLVSAQDLERRRLERNLHDGAQQHLVALKVKLGLAEMLLTRDPAKATATIEQLKEDADEALETLRDLARGIYPPLLADKGLVVALESQARKATVPVRVEADRVGRYAQDVEATVYFCVLEALQNVQKYAHASQVVVRLRDDKEIVTFEVQDDGRGFDTAVAKKGAGLTNIGDRLDALNGTLDITSQPGAGTRLRGAVPT